MDIQAKTRVPSKGRSEAVFVKAEKAAEASSGGGGGGWWGSMFSAATAAVSQAQNLAKEIRGNEDAQKWAEQVRGYGAGLQSLSMLSYHLTPPSHTPTSTNTHTEGVCTLHTHYMS